MKTLDASATLDPSGDESIVVIGVRPEYMIALQNGAITNSEFHPKTFTSEHFLIAPPKNNYLVAKIKANTPGEAVGVVGVIASNSIWGNPPKYKPCNSSTPVFTVPAGKVIYVGEINYKRTESALNLQESQNFIEAEKFISENYPNIKEKLSEAPFEIRKVVGLSCNTTNTAIPIQIYIPRSK